MKILLGFRTNGIFRLCGHHATQVFYENFIDKKGDYLFPFVCFCSLNSNFGKLTFPFTEIGA